MSASVNMPINRKVGLFPGPIWSVGCIGVVVGAVVFAIFAVCFIQDKATAHKAFHEALKGDAVGRIIELIEEYPLNKSGSDDQILEAQD